MLLPSAALCDIINEEHVFAERFLDNYHAVTGAADRGRIALGRFKGAIHSLMKANRVSSGFFGNIGQAPVTADQDLPPQAELREKLLGLSNYRRAVQTASMSELADMQQYLSVVSRELAHEIGARVRGQDTDAIHQVHPSEVRRRKTSTRADEMYD